MTQIACRKARFEFSSDPSHGWLIVTRGDLNAAGLNESSITPYSYQHPEGALLALEEDEDARTFLKAWEAIIERPVEIVETALFPNVRSWPAFGSKDARAVA